VQVSLTSTTASYTEATVLSDPTNSSNLFAGANQTGGCGSTPHSVQAFKSSDAGISWPSNNPPPLLNLSDNAVDPTPAFDAAGTLFYSYIDQQCPSGGAPALVVSKSSDKGATWIAPGTAGNPQVVVTSSNQPDKPALVADTTSSTFQNRLYIAYAELLGQKQPLFVAYSSDHAATWTSVQVDGIGSDTGGSLAIGPTGGTLYVSWWDALNKVIGMATSTNGGFSYTRRNNASSTNLAAKYQPVHYPTNPIAANTSLAVDRSSGGASSHPGNIYVVWNDTDTDGLLHIFFARSTDSGQTWSPSRLRIDTGNTHDAWQPAAAVDQTSGVVSIAWYDRRDDSNNHFYRVYYTQSSDGGSTFSPPMAVSTGSSDPLADPSGTGDYMGITAANGVSHPLWVESHMPAGSALMQAWTAGVNESQPANSWLQQLPPSAPSARNQAGLAYHAASGTLVLFGGRDATSNPTGDTWTWNGTAWTQQSPPSSPTPRSAQTMAYDAAIGKVVLFGGQGVSHGNPVFLADTWTWDGATWTQLRTKTSPVGRREAVMTYDSARQVLVLFGGYTALSGQSYLNDTWTFDGTTWTQQHPTSSPSSRHLSMMAYDPANTNSVLFGGTDQFGTYLSDTWLWNGSSWSQQSPATVPAPREAGVFAYDTFVGRAVLFGGDNCFGCSPYVNNLNDTWYWTGTNWIQQSPQNSPSGRETAVMGYLVATRTLLIFGGSAAGVGLNNETWTY
jgi:hypothetical protein